MTRADVPGLLAALAAVGVAWLVHILVPAVPMLTLCVVAGVIAAQVPAAARPLSGVLAPGVALAAKRAMRIGVVLLGFQLALTDVLRLGWSIVIAVVAVTALSFFGTYWLARLAGLPGNEPILLAAGFSICGASAIGAMAAVTRSPAREQSRPVALVTLCGTLAIAVIPALATLFHLTVPEFGRWAGASVHDVGQVVATAQLWGSSALAIAIVVKLLRVVLLAPIVAGTGLVLRLRGAAEGGMRAPVVPLFVAGFIAAVVVRSLIPMPAPLLSGIAGVQTVLLGMALFGLGCGIRLRALVAAGGRTVLVGLGAWALIAALALVLVAR